MHIKIILGYNPNTLPFLGLHVSQSSIINKENNYLIRFKVIILGYNHGFKNRIRPLVDLTGPIIGQSQFQFDLVNWVGKRLNRN